MLHENIDSVDNNHKPVVHTDDDYSTSTSGVAISFDEEFKLFGISLTIIVQYIFNFDLALGILSSLSLMVGVSKYFNTL
jgi:hypothetical protein